MLMRFEPFREMDRITEELLSQRRARPIPVDAYRRGNEFKIHRDLPGVDPGSVDVDVDNGTLTISAHRTARSDGSVQWLTNERFFGSYRRQLSLGEGVDTTAISATYENGVLTVTIPMAERAKPRKIDIAHGGGQRSIPTTVDAD